MFRPVCNLCSNATGTGFVTKKLDAGYPHSNDENGISKQVIETDYEDHVQTYDNEQAVRVECNLSLLTKLDWISTYYHL